MSGQRKPLAVKTTVSTASRARATESQGPRAPVRPARRITKTPADITA
ncbi:hypothetical protein [Phenylobacterium sp. J367]|nr:hypothetical protein [Phenylobacterium sp. J367]MCR5877828.1 hypothetical protein [Phenylobacterium sp. J367]